MHRAGELAESYGAQQHLIHVIEPIALDSPYELTPGMPSDMQTALVERAEKFLARLAKDFGLPAGAWTVSIGSIKQKIFQLARDNDIDLIVVGTHGRHGIGLLLGSTATSILHGTPCDVYAVKIK